MNVLNLFSGIGGFSLGLERAGMRTVAFCEIEPFCRRLLAKRWPHVPIYGDVRDLNAKRLESDGIAVDVICGGFPCQDVSAVGAKSGMEGQRSGLWREYARLVRELRPRYAIVENVAGLHDRGLGDVLGDLAGCGYDAEWSVFSACMLGAPHARERVFILAYPNRNRQQAIGEERSGDDAPLSCGRVDPRHLQKAALTVSREGRRHFSREPNVGRVAYGVPDRVDRLRHLGNSILPQIPEIIGRAILAAETQDVGPWVKTG